MREKETFNKNKLNIENQKEIKDFWKSYIWKLELKKNICSLSIIILNAIVVILNIIIFALLITAIVLISQKVSSSNYDPSNINLTNIIFLVSLSVSFSLGIIVCSFVLISMRNKNKANIYKKICQDFNYLSINYEGNDIDREIKKVLDKNLIFKKEKLFNSLKKFVSEDEIKWS